jgi:tRNA threonylcarbamoyl adenosine modification protein YeaZ
MSAGSPGWTPDGVYLALETSGPVGSVALARGEAVLSRAFIDRAGEQSSRMLPALGAVLSDAGVPRDALAGVVVGAGPGSFTGVRIAAATAKGLTHALGVPLWAFSSLAAGAISDLVLPPGVGPAAWRRRAAEGDGGAAAPLRWVLFDARGERVYAACYRVRAGGLDVVVHGHPTTVSGLLARPAEAGEAFSGDGAVRHRARFAAAGRVVLPEPAGFPTADALLRLFLMHRHSPPLSDVARWEPEYLKASSAERERPEGARPPGAEPL